MIRRTLIRFFLALLVLPASLPAFAAWDLAQLMDTLAQTRSGRARFDFTSSPTPSVRLDAGGLDHA